jgi:putative ABC transport system permease protein
MFVRSQTGHDQYHANKERIYRLTLEVEGLKTGEIWRSATSSILWAPALKKDYPEVEAFCRIWGNEEPTVFRIGEKEFSGRRVVFAEASVFEFFTWPLLNGDPQQVLREPFSVVLNASTARKYFGNDDPIGKVLLTESEQRNENGETATVTRQYKVTGVFADVPHKSHLKPDAVISFITLNQFFNGDVNAGVHPEVWFWRGRTVHNYLLLKENFPPAELQKKFQGFLDKYVGDATTTRGYAYHPYLQPIAGIHLEGEVWPRFEAGGNRNQLYLFSGIAVFILLIACINFMNLSTARSSLRAREVGIRKVVGAERERLVRQFLGESLLLCFIGLLLALLLVELLNPVFYSYLDREFYFDPQDWPFYIAGISTITLFVGVVAGSYPAFFLANFQPARVLKGSRDPGARGALLRKGLVVMQFAITVFFIVATLTVYNQIRFMRNHELGFKSAQVLVVPPAVTQPALAQIETYRQELLQRTGIRAVAVSSAIPGRSFGGDVWAEKGKPGEEGSGLSEFAVDYDFIDLYGLELIAGRNFQRDMSTDAAPAGIDTSGYELAAIINEAAVKRLGWRSPEEALGKRLVRDPVSNDFTGNVIGVIRDFHFESLHQPIAPAILFINPNYANYASRSRFLSMEISPTEVAGTIAHVQSMFARISTETPFEYYFLDQDFARQYQQDEKMMEVYGNVAGLTIFVACLGILGLASFSAERRTKEIGVRKVLGSSSSRIVGLLAKDFVRLVLLANVIAWPVAYWAMNNWLKDYAYRFELGPGTFLLAGAIALVIATLTVGTQALKAALANPVEALRYE